MTDGEQSAFPDRICKTFAATLDHLYEMLDFILERAQEAGFNKSIKSKIELACEEALVNVIHYGYPHVNGTIDIECAIAPKKGIEIVIRDKGIAYNPLKNRKTTELLDKSDLPAEQRPIGGYGIFFIIKLMDEANYERVDETNVLTLIKRV